MDEPEPRSLSPSSLFSVACSSFSCGWRFPGLLGCAVFMSALTGFLMGFDLSIVAVVLNPINDEFGLCTPKEFTCLKKEIFVAMIAPGALIGSLTGGLLADYYGRRLALFLSDLLFIVGSLTFYFGKSWAVILAARCIVGAGIGLGFVVFATYVTEIAPPERRGRLVVCQEVAQCVGVVLTFMIGSAVNDRHWRLLLLSGSIAAVMQLAGMLFLLPESPRWLLLQGNIVQARHVMNQLNMSEAELMMEFSETNVLLESLCSNSSSMEEVQYQDVGPKERGTLLYSNTTSASSLPCSQQHSVCQVSTATANDLMMRNIDSIWNIEKRPKLTGSNLQKLWSNRRSILIACCIGVAQNVLCTNAALYFSTDLMVIAGICKPYQWGIGLGLMKLLGTIVTYSLVDTLGRRSLLLYGTTGLGIVFVVLAFGYSLVPLPPDVTEAGMFCQSPEGANLGPTGVASGSSVLVLAGLFGLLFFWEISWAGLMYVVAAEIIPSAVRGIGMGFVVSCFWSSLFLSQLYFELSFTILQVSGTFIGLAVASLFVLAFTFFAVPDVTGQPLGRVNRMFK